MNKNIADDALLSMIAQVAQEVRVITACRDEEIYSDDPADHDFFDDERVERILRGGGICIQDTRDDTLPRKTIYLIKLGVFGIKIAASCIAASILLAVVTAIASANANREQSDRLRVELASVQKEKAKLAIDLASVQKEKNKLVIDLASIKAQRDKLASHIMLSPYGGFTTVSWDRAYPGSPSYNSLYWVSTSSGLTPVAKDRYTVPRVTYVYTDNCNGLSISKYSCDGALSKSSVLQAQNYLDEAPRAVEDKLDTDSVAASKSSAVSKAVAAVPTKVDASAKAAEKAAQSSEPCARAPQSTFWIHGRLWTLVRPTEP
jgi:hypothetical protein